LDVEIDCLHLENDTQTVIKKTLRDFKLDREKFVHVEIGEDAEEALALGTIFVMKNYYYDVRSSKI